jgi:hypothetical protein
MPDRCRGPLHAWVAEARRTLPAPVHGRRLPAAFGERGNPGIFLPCSRGGLALSVCANGDEEAGSAAGPSPWEGLAEGAGGMALGPRREGRVEGRDGLQGDAPRGPQRVDPQGMGSDAALIAGHWRGARDGLDAWRDDVCRAPMVGPADGFKGGATRQVGGLQGRPSTPKGPAQGGVLVLQPWQPLRAIVFSGPGAAVGQAPLLPDHATTLGDERCEGAHGGTWWMERRPGIPRRAQPCELQGGIGGSVLRPAGGQASRSRAQGSGLSGQRPSQSSVRRAQTRGPVLRARQIATGWRCKRVRSVGPHAALASGGGARCTHSRVAVPAAWGQISWWASAQAIPTKAAKVWWDVGIMRPLLRWVSVARRHRQADVLRRPEREPVTRQPLRGRS